MDSPTVCPILTYVSTGVVFVLALFYYDPFFVQPGGGFFYGSVYTFDSVSIRKLAGVDNACTVLESPIFPDSIEIATNENGTFFGRNIRAFDEAAVDECKSRSPEFCFPEPGFTFCSKLEEAAGDVKWLILFQSNITSSATTSTFDGICDAFAQRINADLIPGQNLVHACFTRERYAPFTAFSLSFSFANFWWIFMIFANTHVQRCRNEADCLSSSGEDDALDKFEG